MRMLRVSLCSALALVLVIVAAWSFLGIFSQLVSVSITRSEAQLRAGFNSIHVGCRIDGLSVAKPGIPLESDRQQMIGGRTLAEWLRLPKNQENDASDSRDVHAIIKGEAPVNFRSIPVTTVARDTPFPVAGRGSRPPIVLILIPPKGADSLSVQWRSGPNQSDSEHFKPAAVPAFEMSDSGE